MTDFLSVKDNPQHNRRADKCRDRVNGQVAFEGGQARDEVAEQGQVHTKEGRGRDEKFVVAALKEETCDMRHGQAQEGDGTAERRDDSGEEA